MGPLHLLVVFRDAKLTALSVLVVHCWVPLSLLEEGVGVPKLRSFIEGCYFVSGAGVAEAELSHLMHVPFCWLKLDCRVIYTLILPVLLIDLLKTFYVVLLPIATPKG